MVERDKDIYQQFNQLYDEIHKRIIGNDDVIQEIVTCIFAGGHILLESVPGMGKTVLTNVIAEAMECKFKRIQCTPDLTPTDIIGKRVWDENEKKYNLEEGPIFTNILLVDEINRAPPKTQSALLEVMAEGHCTIGGETYRIPEAFTVIATENPVEQEGTFVLPEAQMDRFIFKVVLQYLTPEQEINILKSQHSKEPINKVFNPAEVLVIRKEIDENVFIADSILEYVVRLVDATRTRREVNTGGSPRALVAFQKAAKAKAFLEGRDFVTPSDIKRLAFPILRHRMILNPDSADFGVTADDVIAKILSKVEAPLD
ncbi:MAG: MoxR family ATPase [Candidatus Altiarchaeota archaeon]